VQAAEYGYTDCLIRASFSTTLTVRILEDRIIHLASRLCTGSVPGSVASMPLIASFLIVTHWIGMNGLPYSVGEWVQFAKSYVAVDAMHENVPK